MNDKLIFISNREKFNAENEKENINPYYVVFSLSVVNKKLFDNLVIVNNLSFTESFKAKDDEIINVCPNKGNTDEIIQLKAPMSVGKKYIAQTLKLSGSKSEIIKSLKGLLTYFTENYDETVKNLKPLPEKCDNEVPNIFTGTQDDQSEVEDHEREVHEEGPGFD